jgi:hypothetical protein
MSLPLTWITLTNAAGPLLKIPNNLDSGFWDNSLEAAVFKWMVLDMNRQMAMKKGGDMPADVEG